jgi:hypothetical protein
MPGCAVPDACDGSTCSVTRSSTPAMCVLLLPVWLPGQEP